VCGAAGIGKTSFIDLFIGQFNKEEYIETFRGKKEIILPKTYGFPVKEKKMKNFNLQMIDSPGYGDNMDIKTWKEDVV
jgi:septin family protein